MEMVVGNFLNIFAVSAIIILIIILLMGLSYHFRFIKINLEAGSFTVVQLIELSISTLAFLMKMEG